MKNFFKKHYALLLIFACVIITVLMFLPIYQDHAVLPLADSEGVISTIRVVYDKTPFERLTVIDLEWLLYIAFALLGGALILTFAYFIFRKSHLKEVMSVTLVSLLVALTILLLIAAPQVANY